MGIKVSGIRYGPLARRDAQAAAAFWQSLAASEKREKESRRNRARHPKPIPTTPAQRQTARDERREKIRAAIAIRDSFRMDADAVARIRRED